MKIAIISFNHPESSLVLSKYLAQQGHFVDYFYITKLGVCEVSAFSFGLKTKKVGITSISRIKNPTLYKYLDSELIDVNLITLIRISRKIAWLEKCIIRMVCKKIKSQQYDVVNLIGQHEWLVNFHKALIGLKCVHTLHEVNSHYIGQSISNKLINYLLKEGIPIIVHSKYAKNRLEQILGNEKINIIKMIPFGLFESYQLFESINFFEKYRPYVLFYGFIRPYKGLAILKQAVELLPENISVKFIVAGLGDDPVLQELKNDVRFIVINRSLSNEEIVDLNRNAHHIVCPYTSASQSGIIATTFLYEKPIIASDVGAFNEFIKNGENGYLVQCGNPKDLADKIQLLINSNELYSKLCYGTNFYSVQNNWIQIAMEYVNTFNFIINDLQKK